MYGKNYRLKELCEVLNIEYKRGGKQHKNIISKIRNEYILEINGIYYTLIRPLTEYERLEIIKYNKAKEYIEPILYNVLLHADDNNILLSMSELSNTLYMVNSRFISTKNVMLSTKFEELDDCLFIQKNNETDYYNQITNINSFIYESSDIIRRIIKDILNDMTDRSLISYKEVIHYVNTEINKDTNRPYKTSNKCEDVPNHLEMYRNVMLKYGYDKDSKIKWNDRKYIQADVSRLLGIDYYYNKYDITINKIGIKYELDKRDYIELTNDYVYNKLLDSKQGKLKDIDREYKTLLLDKMIRV